MKKLLCIISGILALSSCGEKVNEPFEKIDAYPTSPETEWIYSSQSILNFFESETSNIVIAADTLCFSVKVRVEKDTVLNETMNVTEFSSKADDLDFSSKEYYYVDAEGLKAYAYSNPSLHVFVKKNAQHDVISNRFSFTILGPAISVEDNIFEYGNGSRLNLKFPLEMHSKWTYLAPAEPMKLQINKEITGYENIKVDNHTYPCYKVSWIYLKNENIEGYDKIRVYDWIAKEGLIKRQVIYSRATLIMSENASWTYCQATETILLKEYTPSQK
jgi:hypothetical protein